MMLVHINVYLYYIQSIARCIYKIGLYYLYSFCFSDEILFLIVDFYIVKCLILFVCVNPTYKNETINVVQIQIRIYITIQCIIHTQPTSAHNAEACLDYHTCLREWFEACTWLSFVYKAFKLRPVDWQHINQKQYSNSIKHFFVYDEDFIKLKWSALRIQIVLDLSINILTTRPCGCYYIK